MKLRVIIALVVILLLGTGGYLYLNTSKNKVASGTPEPTKSATVFSSIQDALTKQLTLKCEYADNENIHTVAYIKNGLIRSDVTDSKDPNNSGSVIIKDKKIYYWNAQKMGFMMAVPEVSGTPTGTKSTNGQDTLAALEKYKQDCHPAVVSDSLFDIPTDVKFTDQSQLMRGIPTSAAGTSGSNYQQQVQQYMQQYQNTQGQ